MTKPHETASAERCTKHLTVPPGYGPCLLKDGHQGQCLDRSDKDDGESGDWYVMTKPHETASAEAFNAYREAWITDNVTIEQALAVPGVAELLLEEFNNKIIDDFDDEHEDEGHENEAAGDRHLAGIEGDDS